MMDCRDIEALLPAYMEGDLPDSDRDIIETHLALCEKCRASLEELKKTGELLGSLKEVEPPAWLTDRIMSRIKKEETAGHGLVKSLFYPMRIKIPIQAIATILVVVVALYLFSTTGPDMQSPSIVAERTQETTETREVQGPPASQPPGKSADKKMDLPSRHPASKTDRALKAPGSPVLPGGKASLPPSSGRKDEEGVMKEETAPPVTSAGKVGKSGNERPESHQFGLTETTKVKRSTEQPGKKPQATTGISLSFNAMIRVKDLVFAAGEVEKNLRELGAVSIRKEDLDGFPVIICNIHSQAIGDLLVRMNKLGQIAEKHVPPEHEIGLVYVKISLFPEH